MCYISPCLECFFFFFVCLPLLIDLYRHTVNVWENTPYRRIYMYRLAFGGETASHSRKWLETLSWNEKDLAKRNIKAFFILLILLLSASKCCTQELPWLQVVFKCFRSVTVCFKMKWCAIQTSVIRSSFYIMFLESECVQL